MIKRCLYPRSSSDTVSQGDLTRLGIMANINTILGAANHAAAELREQLGGDAASAALAIALGKLCAQTGIDLSSMIAMVELTHRETCAERPNGLDQIAV